MPCPEKYRVAPVTDGDRSYHNHKWIRKLTMVKLHQQEKVKKCETDIFNDAPNTTTLGWQWCHRNIKNSMGSGAQCIIVQEQANHPCNIVNQVQSDKRMRFGPSRFPRDRMRKYHYPAREINSRGFHILCSKQSSILGKVHADEESLSITCLRKQELRGKKAESKRRTRR